MAGIYIHIPYCTVKCPYCNFFSLASTRHRERFHELLSQELTLRKDYLGNLTVDTLYFGGGTPSLLHPDKINEICNRVMDLFPLSEDPEITLEANPDDLTPEYIGLLAQTPVNRISVGIQSFHDADLAWLGRNHSAERATQCLADLKAAGFENITVDLIYSIPTLSDDAWLENLETVLSMGIPHISAYALTVEGKTGLAWKIARGKSVPVSDEVTARQYHILTRRLNKAGFCHYEISNFCLPGLISRHNSNYWKGVHYLGLGPSAHSFDGVTRSWNVSNLSIYTDMITRMEQPSEAENLNEVQRYNEYVLTGMRTMWGCDTGTIRRSFGYEAADYFRRMANEMKQGAWDEHFIIEEDGVFRLSEEGMLFADRITAELFLAT